MSVCLRNTNVFSLLNRRIDYNSQKFYNNYNLLSNKLFFTMSEVNRDAVSVLTQRLAKAEKRLKLLKCEISDIKRQLSSITENSNVGDTPTSTRSLSEQDSSSSNTCKKARYDFTKEDDYVVVFTDGACENNGRANAKAGIGVWFGNNHPLNVSQPVNGRPTNNTAEIQACVHAVKIAHSNGIKKLKIKTDSQFVINSMTQWIHRWKKNNWKVASGGDVKNKEDFIILDNACRLLESLVWVHVEGHKGIDGNEQADLLARSGALCYTSNG